MADVPALVSAVDGYFAQVRNKLDAMDNDLALLESAVSDGDVLFSNANNVPGDYVGRLMVSQDIAVVRGPEELTRQQALTQSVNPQKIYDIQADVFYQWNGSSWVQQSGWTVQGQFELGRIYSNNYIGRLFYYSPNQGMLELYAGDNPSEPLIGSYTQLTPITPARIKHVAAVVDDSMYVHGGTAGASNFSPAFWRYDFLNDSWHQLANSSFARRDHTMDAYGDRLFMFGGESSGGVEDNLFVCDTSAGDIWSTPSGTTGGPPPARSKHVSCIVDGKLYIFGGESSGGGALDDLWEYDIAANAWTQLATRSFGAAYDSVMVHYNGYLYVHSGRTGPSTLSGALSRYNIASNSWESVGSSWSICQHRGAVIGNKLYLYGGSDGSTDHYNYLRYINLDDFSQTSLTGGPQDIIRHSMVTWKNKLYVCGGIEDTAGNRVDDLLRIQ